ncbi:MAG TPA: Holliday junction branch migration protein RuvA [Candidatus Kapabacteria bacterium]|nr:Holliday junction branch migration protein RuvA [Candidatus Kapabacteria bacterium]
MISLLRGIVRHKTPFTITLDVGGVGYEVYCTQEAYEKAPLQDSDYQLHTRLIVREDSMTLFGFSSIEERALFDQLISVSGIGPRTGHAMLTGLTPSQLRDAIRSNNLGAITGIPGIGKKTAERLVLELRDKILKEDFAAPTAGAAETGDRSAVRNEALQALIALGYQRATAEKAIRVVLRDRADEGVSTERLIKAALKEAINN